MSLQAEVNTMRTRSLQESVQHKFSSKLKEFKRVRKANSKLLTTNEERSAENKKNRNINVKQKALLAQVFAEAPWILNDTYGLAEKADFWCEIFAVFENDECIINLKNELRTLNKTDVTFICDVLGTWKYANQRYNGETFINEWKKLPLIYQKEVQVSFEYVTKVLDKTLAILIKNEPKKTKGK